MPMTVGEEVEFSVWKMVGHIVSFDLMQLDVTLWQEERTSENLNFIEWFMQALYKVTLSFPTELLRFSVLSEYCYHHRWHPKHFQKKFFAVLMSQTSVLNKDVSVNFKAFPNPSSLLTYSTVNC